MWTIPLGTFFFSFLRKTFFFPPAFAITYFRFSIANFRFTKQWSSFEAAGL
jgi:hypothetical protein